MSKLKIYYYNPDIDYGGVIHEDTTEDTGRIELVSKADYDELFELAKEALRLALKYKIEHMFDDGVSYGEKGDLSE